MTIIHVWTILHHVAEEHPAATDMIYMRQTRLVVDVISSQNFKRMTEQSSNESRISKATTPIVSSVFVGAKLEHSSQAAKGISIQQIKRKFPSIMFHSSHQNNSNKLPPVVDFSISFPARLPVITFALYVLLVAATCFLFTISQ